MKNLFTLFAKSALLALWFAGFAGAADMSSPVGRWKTISDEDGKPRGIIEIIENNGIYEGFIRERFPRPDDDPEGKCRDCPGQFKDQPIIGMKTLWGLKKEGNEYRGGEVFDPKKRKIYKAKITVAEDGKSLKLRGFIGVSLIGRTQTWLREE
jgi:uncharacterized protein (DUF2147 family)